MDVYVAHEFEHHFSFIVRLNPYIECNSMLYCFQMFIFYFFLLFSEQLLLVICDDYCMMYPLQNVYDNG